VGLEEAIYLMSIKPKYAMSILSGRKKYELRRLEGLPPIEEGSTVVVYASGRVRSIVGEFRAGRVYLGLPEKIWGLVSRPGAGVDEEAWNYIKGSRRAMAIEVRDPKWYPVQVKLDEIRRIIPGWMPPYSYRRIVEGDPFYELILRPLWDLMGQR
jgi:predicted transcriptional regulator